MATRAAVIADIEDVPAGKITWEGIVGSADDGASVRVVQYGDKTVHIVGSAGTGGQITIQGSNDGGTTWTTLHDAQGNDLAAMIPGTIELIAESPIEIRPNGSAGTGADIDVIISYIKRGP